MKKSIIGLVTLGVLLVASGRAVVRPASALQSLCSTPPQATCSLRNTFDFPSIPAHSSAEMTITVTGAHDRDEVIVTPSAGLEDGLTWTGYVSDTDTVVLRVLNVTDNAIDPFNRRFRVTVNQYD